MKAISNLPKSVGLSEEKETAVRLFSEQIGSQIGQLVTNFLYGLLTVLLSDNSTKSGISFEKSSLSNNPTKLLTAAEVPNS